MTNRTAFTVVDIGGLLLLLLVIVVVVLSCFVVFLFCCVVPLSCCCFIVSLLFFVVVCCVGYGLVRLRFSTSAASFFAFICFYCGRRCLRQRLVVGTCLTTAVPVVFTVTLSALALSILQPQPKALIPTAHAVV